MNPMPPPAKEPPALAALTQGPFSPGVSLHDVAVFLLSFAVHDQQRLCDQLGKTPKAAVAPEALVCAALCTRMFERTDRPHLQSLACEVFSIAFPMWRAHLRHALKPSAAGAKPSEMKRIASSPGMGTDANAAPPAASGAGA